MCATPFFTEPYPSDVGFPAYATLGGVPTVCGGIAYTGKNDSECFSLSKSGNWELSAKLSDYKSSMGFTQLTEDSLLISGNHSIVYAAQFKRARRLFTLN